MPNFLEMAGQFANVRQSQAAEQNNLALLAQRQREESGLRNVQNYMARPGFNPDDPNLGVTLSTLSPDKGGAIAKSLQDARTAAIAAQTATRTESSAARQSTVGKLGSFKYPFEVYASLVEAKNKGNLDEITFSSLTNSLRQHVRKDPVGGLDAFKDEVAFGQLTPTERLKRENITVNRGGSIVGKSRREYGAPNDPYAETFVEAATMSPAERASHALALSKQEQEVRESNQRMMLARQEVTSLPGNPGYGITKDQKIIRIPFAALPNEPKKVTRDPETGAYIYTMGDLDGKDFKEANNASRARYTLSTVLGYGTQDFSNTLQTLKKTTKGLADKTASEITKLMGEESETAQAMATFNTLSNNVILGMVDYQVGAQVSDKDVERFAAIAGVVEDENASIGQRLAAFEEAVKIMKRIGYMPKDDYDPFTGKGLVGQRTGGAPRTLSGTNLTVPTPPGQGTVTRAPPAALSYTPEEADAALRKFGVIQ
jgi:hypothetical protein